MRKLIAANFILGLGIAMTSISAAPVSAQARDYKWCAQGRQEGYPGDCNYQTRAQCLASVSGRDADCGINPRFAFGAQRRGIPPAR